MGTGGATTATSFSTEGSFYVGSYEVVVSSKFSGENETQTVYIRKWYGLHP